MRRMRSWALAGVVLVTTVAVPNAPAAAAPETTVLARTSNVTVVRDGDWVRRSYTAALPSATVTQLQGQAVDGRGCRYSGTERVRPGAVPVGMVVVEREVAHNLATCQLRMERGVVPAGSLAAADGRQDSREAFPAGEAGVSTRASTGAYHRTYYEDPVTIDVTGARAELRWSYNWSCVTNSWDHVGRWDWFTPSGWVREAHSVNAYRDCNGATTIVYGRFRNTPFCWPLPPTYNEYDVTVVKGQRDGSYWMQWNAYKWGGCNELLSFHRSHGRI